MGHMLRWALFFGGTIANGLAAMIYYRAGLPIIDLAQGAHSGPATGVADTITIVVPLALVLIELGLVLFVIYGPVTTERARATRRVR